MPGIVWRKDMSESEIILLVSERFIFPSSLSPVIPSNFPLTFPVSLAKTANLIGLSSTEFSDKSWLGLVMGEGKLFLCEVLNCRSASTQSCLLTWEWY